MSEYILPHVNPPDYSEVSPDGKVPAIPENFEKQFATKELVAKVTRKVVKGRIDGK